MFQLIEPDFNWRVHSAHWSFIYSIESEIIAMSAYILYNYTIRYAYDLLFFRCFSTNELPRSIDLVAWRKCMYMTYDSQTK